MQMDLRLISSGPVTPFHPSGHHHHHHHHNQHIDYHHHHHHVHHQASINGHSFHEPYNHHSFNYQSSDSYNTNSIRPTPYDHLAVYTGQHNGGGHHWTSSSSSPTVNCDTNNLPSTSSPIATSTSSPVIASSLTASPSSSSSSSSSSSPSSSSVYSSSATPPSAYCLPFSPRSTNSNPSSSHSPGIYSTSSSSPSSSADLHQTKQSITLTTLTTKETVTATTVDYYDPPPPPPPALQPPTTSSPSSHFLSPGSLSIRPITLNHHHQLHHHQQTNEASSSIDFNQGQCLPETSTSSVTLLETSSIDMNDHVSLNDLNDQGTIRMPKKRNTANKKERKRTVSINTAFSLLRDRIPNVPPDTKLSKIKTLRLATKYISWLMTALETDSAVDEHGNQRLPVVCEDFKVDLRCKEAKRDSNHLKMNLPKETSMENYELSMKKSKGRTGWPQHVWALNLKREHSES